MILPHNENDRCYSFIFAADGCSAHFFAKRHASSCRSGLAPRYYGLALCLFVNTLQQETFQTKHYLYPFLFTPAYMTKVNGMAVTFAMDLAYVAVDKPEGYSADEAEATLKQYGDTSNVFPDGEKTVSDQSNKNNMGQSDDANGSKANDSGQGKEDDQLPNIIVIMDEAFSDLAVVGDLETNEDYMPFMHKMQQGADNAITGYAQVSVCGGNTANSSLSF